MTNINSLLRILGTAVVAAIFTTSAARGDTAAFPFSFVLDHSVDGGNDQHGHTSSRISLLTAPL